MDAVSILRQSCVMSEIECELVAAKAEHPLPYASPHEAYAVLLEEVEEFWSEVRKRPAERSVERMLVELRQIAVVAIRAIESLESTSPESTTSNVGVVNFCEL